MKFPLINLLQKPLYLLIATGTAILFFGLNYYLMASLPGEIDKMCKVGADLTLANIAFSGILSIFIGFFAGGLVGVVREKRIRNKAALTAVSGSGFAVGSLTVFCGICTFPVVSLFGLSFGLGFLNDYNLLFKFLSFGLVLLGLYLLNRQLEDKCNLCDNALSKKRK